MRYLLLLVLACGVCSSAFACYWNGKTDSAGYPIFVECLSDVVAHVRKERDCKAARVRQKKEPAICKGLIEKRAALFRKYADKNPEVHDAVSVYLASGAYLKP